MSLSSGVVINEWGLESSQQDLLIVDSSVSPAFVTDGRLGLYPVESVLAAIEVKSRLTTDTVASAVRSGASLKRLLSPVLQPMRRVERHGQVLYEPETERSAQDVFMKPFTAIVGLNGDARPETLLRAFVEANLELDEIDRTNTLILIDSFVTAWSPRDEARVLQSYPQDALTACRVDMGEDSALYFYAFLLDGIQQYRPPEPNLRGYLEAGEFGAHVGVAQVISLRAAEGSSADD